MDLCISTGSVWFRVSVVAMIGLTLANLSYYLWSLTSRLRLRLRQCSQNLNKRKKKKKKRPDRNDNTRPLLLPVPQPQPQPNLDVMVDQPKEKVKEVYVKAIRKFEYQSLADATQGFLSDCQMSFDRLGEVFKGQMVDTNEVFAIRRLGYPKPNSKDFMDEVLLMSQLNHPNLAKLIGYCIEAGDRYLIYEYFPERSLQERLHESEICLEWSMRMKIALGVAKALEYLQNTMKPPILHTIIQPSNIWLTEECTPKLAASGVARLYSCPSDRVGSNFYALSDYSLTNEITIQADIRGFGMLLLELITGKKGYFQGENGGQFLIKWVEPYLENKQNLDEMFDPKLKGSCNKEEMYEACAIAEMCIEKQLGRRLSVAKLVTKMNHLVTRDSLRSLRKTNIANINVF